MTQQFDVLLDQCLSVIQAGDASLESCLEGHPEHAHELSPLLVLAAHSHSLLAPAHPSDAFVKATRARVVRTATVKAGDRASSRPWSWIRRSQGLKLNYALVAILLVIMLLGSSLGVVRASADSLPGDALYRVKLRSEQFQIAMSFSAESDAALLMKFAQRRLSEVEQLIEEERYEDLDLAISGFNRSLDEVANLEVAVDEQTLDSLNQIEARLAKHIRVLNRVKEQVPDSAKASIEKALERSSHSEAVIKKVKSEEHPSNSAPGQLKKDDTTDTQPDRGNGRDKEKPKKTEKPK